MIANVSRRDFLVAGGGAALGALMFSRQAMAALSTSARFDLTDASDPLFREKPLRNVTVMQSFAFDNLNHRIYVAQVVQGGVQLAEAAPLGGSARDAAGDLCITQLDFAGNQLGQMYLLGFGHGVSIGAEPVGSSAYLWTEVDAISDGTSARGSALASFPFVDRAVLTNSSPMTKHRPVAGATNTTVSIDFAYNQLVMRYSLDGIMRFSVYSLPAVKAGNYTPLATVDQPAEVAADRPFQGYTSFGRYLYMLEGSAYGSFDSTEAGHGNTYLTSVDLSTGQIVQREFSQAGFTLSYREPEGMAVQLTNSSDLNTARLCFGFASGSSGARLASIYYKDLLI